MKMSEIQKLTQAMAQSGIDANNVAATISAAEQLGIRLDRVYQEMEMDDPFVDTHEDPGLYHPGAINLHSHSFYELLYICSGSVPYLIGTERYRLQAGDVVFVPPGISHRPLLDDGTFQIYRRYVLWLSPAFVQSMGVYFSSDGFTCPNLLRTANTKYRRIERMFQNGIRERIQEKPGWRAALYANTLALMAELYRIVTDAHTQHPTSEKPQLLDQILSYIEENMASRITMADITGKFYISESTVGTIFRKEMGISFYKCVTQRRLIAAKNLMLSQDSLENVAAKVGFPDYSAFYRAFKREYGISPRQYREELAKSTSELSLL